jgi:hypothetical protein
MIMVFRLAWWCTPSGAETDVKAGNERKGARTIRLRKEAEQKAKDLAFTPHLQSLKCVSPYIKQVNLHSTGGPLKQNALSINCVEIGLELAIRISLGVPKIRNTFLILSCIQKGC